MNDLSLSPGSQSSAGDSMEALVGQVAEEFLQQTKRGEQPDIEEYARRYPVIAPLLRQVLAALQLARVPAADLAADDSPLFAGQVTGCLGEFRIIQEIGRGGMGVVYEAVQVPLGRRVALKVLPFAAAVDPKQLQRFKIEAQAAAHLHHQNIVPVYAVGCERGVHYYAMQYIEGRTLAAVIRELRQLTGLETAESADSMTPPSAVANELLSGRWAPAKPRGSQGLRSSGSEQPTGPYQPTTSRPHDLTTSQPLEATPPVAALSTERSANNPAFFRTVAHLGVQAAEALEHAHAKGIIHRDIKPANLLLDVSGNLWITDFGLARILSEAGLTMTGDLVGTLRYMSPEQALAKRVPLDQRTDIYSLGVTLYELLTLRPAYDGRDRQEILQQIAFEEPRLPRRLNKAIPVELETIVGKAMGKNPAERYATAQELADDLRRFLDDKPIRAKRPTLLDWSRKWARRHQGVVATGIAGLIITVAILTVSILMLLAAYRTAEEQRNDAILQRQRAESRLYESLLDQVRARQLARETGYRAKVWDLLKQAMQVQTPDKDLMRLRQEAVACLGDFVGLQPTTWEDFHTEVYSMALHPNGRQVLIGLADGTVLLRDLITGVVIARLEGEHRCPVDSLSFSADGNRMASVDLDGNIRVWQVNAGSEWACMRTILLGHARRRYAADLMERLVCAVLSPDGQSLATYSGDHSKILLYNLAGEAPSATLETPGLVNLGCLAFSPDGKLLVAVYRSREDAHLRLWDFPSRVLKKDIHSDLGIPLALVFSADGKYLACAGERGGMLFELPDFQRLPVPRFGFLSSISFSPDSTLLAFADKHGPITLWDRTALREVAVLDYPLVPHTVTFSQDAKKLIAANERSVRMWDLAGADEKIVLSGHAGGVPSSAFSPDGKLLASAGKDRTVRIWNPYTGQLLHTLADFKASVQTVAFSLDGKLLATGDWTGGIRLWDVESRNEVARLDHPLGPQIWAVTFSAKNNLLAACGVGGVIIGKVNPDSAGRRPEPRRPLGQMQRPSIETIGSVVFNPDGSLVAWTTFGGDVHLWDVENRRAYDFPPLKARGDIRNLAFTQDGQCLVFKGEYDVPDIWNIATRKKVLPSGADDFHPRTDLSFGVLALSADSDYLAVQGRRASIWDMRNRKLLVELPEKREIVYGLTWSPKDDLLAVTAADGGPVIWNLAKIKAQLDPLGLGW